MGIDVHFNPEDMETSVERRARLAQQKVGSTAGIHPKVLEAQEAEERKQARKRRTQGEDS